VPVNLRDRNFLKELDFTPAEWRFLLDRAADFKRAKRDGSERPQLTGKNFALVFEKTSTRTRCAFEVAAHDQGAHVTYLDSEGSQIGHKESIKDTARVLGRFYDGIEFRGSAQALVETLGAYAGVPVWNGLTDQWHPTQTLCDVLTMREHSAKPDSDIAFAYLGDARNNVGNSLLIAGALMGMDVRIVAPREQWNQNSVVTAAEEVAAATADILRRARAAGATTSLDPGADPDGGAGIDGLGDFAQDIGGRRRVIAVIDFRQHAARRDAAGREMSGKSERRIAERDVGVGQRLGAGGGAEGGDLIIGRVEPVGGGVFQLRDDRFGARVKLAVLNPQRGVFARGIKRLGGLAFGRAVDAPLHLLAGDDLAQPVADLRVAGGEYIVERAARVVEFALEVVADAVGILRRGRDGLAFPRRRRQWSYFAVAWRLTVERRR